MAYRAGSKVITVSSNIFFLNYCSLPFDVLLRTANTDLTLNAIGNTFSQQHIYLHKVSSYIFFLNFISLPFDVLPRTANTDLTLNAIGMFIN